MKDELSMVTIREAHDRIRPYIRRTPLLRAEKMDKWLGCRAYLKPEMIQITGSFKPRGALNKVLQLGQEDLGRGLIASSSGNHAQALAYAGRLVGAKAVLVVPTTAPKIKIDSARDLGAEVIVFEGAQKERWAYVDELIEKYGYTMVNASDDPVVMAGQGTIALEIMEDLPDVDTIIVPLGGGGLLSGIVVAAKETNPHIRIIGVEPAAAPKYYVSRKNGAPMAIPAKESIADGVREENPGKNAYRIIEQYVDELTLAEELHIAQGLRMLAQDAKLFAEGAAAVGIGAVLSGNIKFSPEERVCFVLSAGNWELERFIAACSIKQ